jgi:STE24 endopeptidase
MNIPQIHLWFFWLFVILYLAHLSVEIFLDLLNLKELEKHRRQIPALFQNSFSPEEYEKSIAYTRSKIHFSWFQTGFDALVLWLLILTGGFGALDQWLDRFFPVESLPHQVAYPLLVGGIFYLLHLPFGIYHSFVLEERFGFNKTTGRTFALDQIKTLLVGLFLGVPLLTLIFKSFDWLGNLWWLGGWGVVMGFQLLTAALLPVILIPLFYKFTPLETGELKERIHRLAEKIRFKMSGVFTIDGSRRSTHSNAFFAGMGRARRIVLFDTLATKLTTPEILSVLAHEMGHNVKKHIQKSLLLSAFTALAGFYFLSLLLDWQPFFTTFGVSRPGIHVGLVLFGLLSSVFAFPVNPLFKWISRRNEYEADRFSVEVTGDKANMQSSLIKLSRDNLSNLTPHPWYSFYHYSHPTTAERVQTIAALKVGDGVLREQSLEG